MPAMAERRTERGPGSGGDGSRSSRPRIWLLVGEKPGDNAQARALAEALGWPFEERRLVVSPRWRVSKPRVRASLSHLDPERSDVLEPPWPHLVIAIGRRLSSPALWIKQRSGGSTRIVLIGKPRRLMGHFDLVVAASQYRLRPRPNVFPIDLPLLRVDPAAVSEAALRWRPHWETWPRPLTAVCVGGPIRRLRFDARVADRLVEDCRALLRADGGSLYVTTSRRTPVSVVEALARGLPPEARLYRWDDLATENPYLGLLGLADRLVVTSDSVSMLVEVARLRKPLAIFQLPEKASLRGWFRPPSRDLSAIPGLLRERGWAVELGEPFADPADAPPDELDLVAERVRDLARDAADGDR